MCPPRSFLLAAGRLSHCDDEGKHLRETRSVCWAMPGGHTQKMECFMSWCVFEMVSHPASDPAAIKVQTSGPNLVLSGVEIVVHHCHHPEPMF